jgi:hypothetical protein
MQFSAANTIYITVEKHQICMGKQKNKPQKQAVANFRLNTGHNCLTAHLHRTKIFNRNNCTIYKLKNTVMDKDHLLVCPKMYHTSNELPKLYWDAIQDLPLDDDDDNNNNNNNNNLYNIFLES